MIIATSLVMDRLRKRLLERTPELPEEQIMPAMEKLIQQHGEERDACGMLSLRSPRKAVSIKV